MTTPKYATSANPLFGTGQLKDRNGVHMSAPMTNALVCRFARRTRNYERIYERFQTPDAMEQAAKTAGCRGYELMEKLYKICSVTSTQHRTTFEQEKTLLRKIERNDACAVAEDTVDEQQTSVGQIVSREGLHARVEKCFTMTS